MPFRRLEAAGHYAARVTTSNQLTALPAGHRLVHIGFPKTGTTSLQSSLETARPILPSLGAAYPGKQRYHRDSTIAVVGATPRIGSAPPNIRKWKRLVRQVASTPDKRVMISSEWLCEADEATVRRIVQDLGDERVHVVATLRPLAKILPSAWQQYVQNGVRTTYPAWLDGMLRKPPYNAPTASFWRRHRHAEILARWTSVVGPDRVTLVVVDETDHDKLLRQFEAMLALPAGTLQAHERTNRSLTRPETELIRWLNRHYRERQEWPDELYRSVVRVGIAEHLARQFADTAVGAPIITAPWALERAREIATEAAGHIAALGITVVGDLDSLSRIPELPSPDPAKEMMLSAEVAADAVSAAINAARAYGRREVEAALPRQVAKRRAVTFASKVDRRLGRLTGRSAR